MVAGFMAADSMVVSRALDFTPAFPASMAADFAPDLSMAAGFTPGSTNFKAARFRQGFTKLIPARLRQGFMNFMPAPSTTAILANSTDLITTASAVGLLSSPPLAPGGAANGAGPTTITQTAATTGPDPTPGIGITAPIRRATTPT